MADFDEKELLSQAKAATQLDVAGWDQLFEDMGFKAWRRAEEVPPPRHGPPRPFHRLQALLKY